MADSAGDCSTVKDTSTTLNITTSILSASISFIGIIANTAIISIVIKDPLKKLRTPFNYFLVNLALSDLIIAVITMPISFYVHFYDSFNGIVSGFWSEVLAMSYFISAHASLLSLLALSFDRYIAIVKSIKYRLYLSWKRCIKVSFGIWIFSLTLPFAYFQIGYASYLMYYGNTTVILGFVIMIIIYVKIQKFFYDHETDFLSTALDDTNNRTASLQRESISKQIEKKVTDVFFTIIMFFIATYITASIFNAIVHLCHVCSCYTLHVFRDVQFSLVVLNSCINPLICLITLKQYRLSIRELFKNCGLEWCCSYKTLQTNEEICENLMEPLIVKTL